MKYLDLFQRDISKGEKAAGGIYSKSSLLISIALLFGSYSTDLQWMSVESYEMNVIS